MFYRETLGLRFPEKEVLGLQARARILLIAGLFQKLVSRGSWSWSPVNLQFSFQLEFRCWKEPLSPRLWLELLHTAACLARVCLTHARTAFHGHVIPQGCGIWTEVLLPRRTEVLGPTSLKSAPFLFWIWNPKALWLWWALISQLLGSCWEWAHSSVFLKTVHVLMVL